MVKEMNVINIVYNHKTPNATEHTHIQAQTHTHTRTHTHDDDDDDDDDGETPNPMPHPPFYCSYRKRIVVFFVTLSKTLSDVMAK